MAGAGGDAAANNALCCALSLYIHLFGGARRGGEATCVTAMHAQLHNSRRATKLGCFSSAIVPAAVAE